MYFSEYCCSLEALAVVVFSSQQGHAPELLVKLVSSLCFPQ